MHDGISEQIASNDMITPINTVMFLIAITTDHSLIRSTCIRIILPSLDSVGSPVGRDVARFRPLRQAQGLQAGTVESFLRARGRRDVSRNPHSGLGRGRGC